jgi:hypothetical protein
MTWRGELCEPDLTRRRRSSALHVLAFHALFSNQLIRCDRQVAHAFSGCMINCICHRSGNASNTDFAHAERAHGNKRQIGFTREMRRVSGLLKIKSSSSSSGCGSRALSDSSTIDNKSHEGLRKVGRFWRLLNSTLDVRRSAFDVCGCFGQRKRRTPNVQHRTPNAERRKERAGEGNRTLVSSLGSWRSAIELHPRKKVDG